MTPAEKILKALKEREWRYMNGAAESYIVCPDCNNSMYVGHTEDCSYLEAIREAEKMVEKEKENG